MVRNKIEGKTKGKEHERVVVIFSDLHLSLASK